MNAFKTILCGSLAIVSLIISGCATPRVAVQSATPLLGSVNEKSKIPVRSFHVESNDKPYEIKSDMRFMSGESRGVMFPKQAREFLAQDLKDYLSSRFIISPNADVSVNLNLEQSHNFFTMRQSGANWIPFVGVVTSIADGFQKVPVTFIVEVKANVNGPSTESEKIDAFIRKTDAITGWSGTIEKHREIYQKQIQEVRRELFDRLDAQLLTLWTNGRFVGSKAPDERRAASVVASEVAKLDTALADGKISQQEHAALTQALLAKQSSTVPASALPSPALETPHGAPVKPGSVATTQVPAAGSQTVPAATLAVSTETINNSNSSTPKVEVENLPPEPTSVSAPGVKSTELGLKCAFFSNEILITSVAPGSAAAHAGLKINDQIVSCNQEKPSLQVAQKITQGHGRVAELVFKRGNSSETKSVTLNW